MREGLKAGHVPVAGPWITEREVRYVADAAANAWYENANSYNDRFEKKFAEYVGVRHAISLPSCTSAIHLSLLALGVGPGDEVVVPELTWIASAAPIAYVGATPVFADVDPVTWCLSAASFAACVTRRTKAVIPVHLYGNVCNMDAVRRVADKRGIAIVEDAAEAIGAEFHGRRCGSLGDTGVFSFHGSKTLTTGEGGMLVTDRDDVRQRVLFLRDHGRTPGDHTFRSSEVAYKYKMSGVQAALGLAQLERIEELLARKREIFSWYREELGKFDVLEMNSEAPGTRSSFWMVTLLFGPYFPIRKQQLIADLAERGIDSRPFFEPLSSLPAFAGTAKPERPRKRNPVSYQLARRGINLPSALTLDRATVHRVCEVLRELLGPSAPAPHRRRPGTSR